ncbi:MAG TPA: lysine--tRNA ligase, partial [Candidatus Paceibacterota bacterium]|nr:lysine--tRNA ligase [Candidatus Paceibacterota bacterium]
DGLPAYLDRETFEKELGKPLYAVPSPDGKAKNYAEYFAEEYIGAITEAGFKPEFYRASELYFSGAMDGVIRGALEGAEKIRRIYKEVSGGERKDGWLPISVICPQCGKMATTDATDFDGETVLVNCYPTKAPYTQGCGFEGRVSPFGGKAKLPWKPEWAAKWKVVGVDIEGGGKDHYSKGGARDVARHIAKEVFNYPEPFGVPNEFFLVGGKKMASSKGLGSSAKEIVDLVPAKIFRLALFGKDINQQIDFNPEGDTIPVLFDQYDKLAEGYKANKEDDYARLFKYVNREGEIPEFLPRFSQVAFLVQMPHMSLEGEVEAMKGSALTAADKKELEERALYSKRWLEAYAPEKFVFKLQDDMPEAAKNLSPIQKDALKMLKEFIESKPEIPSGEDLHAKLHALKEEAHISPADLFSAIYLSFLGKAYGPKAGWFLSVLDRGFVLKRLGEVAN